MVSIVIGRFMAGLLALAAVLALIGAGVRIAEGSFFLASGCVVGAVLALGAMLLLLHEMGDLE